MQEQLQASRPQTSSSHGIDLRQLLSACLHADGHREQRAHDDNKENRFLGQSEPEHGDWKPTNTRQALQADQQAANRLFEEFVAGHAQAEDQAEQHGNSITDHHALHADSDSDPVTVILKAAVHLLGHAPRRRKQIGRPQLELGQKYPQAHERTVKDEVAEGAFHSSPSGAMRGLIPSRYSTSNERLISSFSSLRISRAVRATSQSSRCRGRGRSMGNSDLTRPGRKLRRATRSPSRTASRTLCVTKITVRPVSDQMRSSSSCSKSRV